MIRRLLVFGFVCFLFAMTVFAQGVHAPAVNAPDPAVSRDREERAALAEQIVRDRETASGRALDPEARNLFVKALQGKQLELLRTMALTPAPFNVGDTSADLLYTPVAPCRIIDTRLAGGPIAAGTTRNFIVAGNGTTTFTSQGGTSGGCGIPNGPATAVLINFVAVNPQGAGNLKGSAFPNAIPATGSILNYQALSPTLNIANAVAFPICDPSVTTCGYDIILLANASATDVVADVLGYFRALRKNQVTPSSTTATASSGAFLPNGSPGTCMAYTGGTITVNAPVPGHVRISAHATFYLAHTFGADTEVDLSIGPTATCGGTFGGDKNFAVVASEATGSYFPNVAVEGVFAVPAGPTTFYLSGQKFDFAGTPDSVQFWNGGLVATFEPN